MRANTGALMRGALLLALAVVVLAHGDEEGHAMPAMESMGHHTAEAPADDGTHSFSVSGNRIVPGWSEHDQGLYDMPSYFGLDSHSSLIYAHIIVMTIAWFFVLPTAVMFSIARSRFTILSHLLFLATNAIGVFLSVIYDAQTPDLYENNAHHTLGWVITWIAVAWAGLGVITIFGNRNSSRLAPVSTSNMAEYQRLTEAPSPNTPGYRWSDAGHSRQGSESSNPTTLQGSSRSNSWTSDQFKPHRFQDEEADDGYDMRDEPEKRSFLRKVTGDSFWASHVSKLSLGKRAMSAINFVYVFLERTILVLGFMGILTGWVTFGGVGRDNHVFNVLAHLIKGGIFIWYGILSFGRYLGCFADFGWAWNRKPGPDVVGRGYAWIPSAEFTESFVIALYGGTNVWMEHMSNAGKAYSPMDLQHVSITILFFGGGVLGMLIDSQRIRKLLNSTLIQPRHARPSDWQEPDSYVHALNPMPATVIMLLGLMMSMHEQHSMLSSMLHKQWGTLFVGFAMARAVSYVTLWLKPPMSYLPSRPPSEIVSAFCLISGGIVFMASNGDAVYAMSYFEVTPMFCFTVTMGATGLIMSLEVGYVCLKNWLVLCQRNSAVAQAISSSAA